MGLKFHHSTAWRNVVLSSMLEYDLQEHHLELLSNSGAVSYELISLQFYNTELVGGTTLYFDIDLVRWTIFGDCFDEVTIPFVNLPEITNKVWKITRTEVAIILFCWDTEVARVQLEDVKHVDNCQENINATITHITVTQYDTATDFIKSTGI